MAKKKSSGAAPERFGDTIRSTDKERTGRGISFILSAIFIAAILVAGSAILVFSKIGGGDDAGPLVAPAPSGQQHTQVQPADERPTCGDHRNAFSNIVFDAFGTRAQVPVNAAGQLLAKEHTTSKPASAASVPACVMWEKVGVAYLPYSTTDGPTEIIDGRAAGFAHTSQGAVLAGIHILWAATNLRDAQLAGLFSAQIDAPAADKAQLQRDVQDAARVEVAASSWVRVADADDSAARISVAMGPTAEGKYLASDLDMIWRGGDWVLSVPRGFPPSYDVVDISGWENWA